MLPVLRGQTNKNIRIKNPFDYAITKVVRRKVNDSIADGENTDGAERLKHSKMTPEVLRTYFFRLLTNELRSVGMNGNRQWLSLYWESEASPRTSPAARGRKSRMPSGK